MTKKEGLARMDRITRETNAKYKELEAMYNAVSHPVTKDVQAEADKILKSAVSLAVMAVNFKELPAEAKKPLIALLYATVDAVAD